MSGGQRKFHGIPIPARKERDEDLLLFRELHKKEKDRIVSLLQPVSEDFEANGNYPLYPMTSAKKGSAYDFLGDSEKSDYNWLKTPPATPLFQSLEMDAIAPHLAVQRELPIALPPSRFAGNSVTTKQSRERSKSPNPKQKDPPRSVTPSQRPSILAAHEIKATTKNKPIMASNQKLNESMISNNTPINRRENAAPTATKPVLNAQQKEGPQSFLASNLTKSMGPSDSKMKTISRGLSPLVRSTIPAQNPGFIDEKTRNLRTDRSSSASGGRTQNQSSLLAATINVLRKPESTIPAQTPGYADEKPRNQRTDRSSLASRVRNQNQSSLLAAKINVLQKPESAIPAQTPGFTDEKPRYLRTDRSSSASRGRNQNQSSLIAANNNVLQKAEPTPNTIRRQSCSPSVTRGRKLETKQESIMSNNVETCTHEIANKGRTQLTGGIGTQLLGSRMVDKFMNARKSSTEERETMSKLRGSINESSGYVRIMMSKSLVDIAQKHMDVKRDPAGAGNSHRAAATSGRYANSRMKTTPGSSSS